MDEVSAAVEFNALDRAIIAMLFISFGVIGLFQLGNLFAGRYVRFALIAVATGTVSFIPSEIGLGWLCAASPSALVCNNEGQALASLLFVWVYISLGALVLFGYVRGLKGLAKQ